MTSPNSGNMDDLKALLEERARYEKWIAQLTARRDQTPPHVFERVRSDYATRLDTVTSQLRSHGEGLQASAASIEQRATSLATDEQARRDARAEIELRAMVGEYSNERATMELAACDADIARLESERNAATAELGRLQEILSVVRPADARPASPPPPAAPSRPLGAPVPRAEVDTTAQELAFLNSVVERPEAAPAPVAAAPAPAPVAPAPAPVAPAPRVATGDIPLVTSLQDSDEHEPANAQPQTLRQTAGTPAFLKGMPTEQVKSLKCQECGTMNYPTEWYCERCGGELAAM
jgi:hypothetical protein